MDGEITMIGQGGEQVVTLRLPAWFSLSRIVEPLGVGLSSPVDGFLFTNVK